MGRANLPRAPVPPPSPERRRDRPRWRSFAAASGGNAAVELALLAPLLVLLLVAVAEYGRAYAEQLRLGRLARAEAQYAAVYQGASAVLAEIEAKTTTLPDGERLIYDAERRCRCAGGGGAAGCSSPCGGTTPELLVQVSVSRPLQPMLFFPDGRPELTLSATAVLRVR